MTFEEFLALQDCAAVSSPLQALWYAQRGDWQRAHQIVQDEDDADSAWVHAYLHRQEGDLDNARYWYRRSGKPASQAELGQEWDQITRNLLEKG
jgi:hypothetical protein